MTNKLRINVALTMQESGVVPLYYNPDVEICKNVIRSCWEGGLKLFEFTNRGVFAHEVFGQLSKWAADEFPEMILGAGSIVEAGTCSLYIQQGASFVVSPLLNEDMAKVCNRRKVLWMPGCATVSEISKAEELGAEVVKIFPAPQLGGPAFIESIKGPCPWSQLMPSGGVSTEEKNIRAWFDAGAFCVGMGSKLITKEIIRNRDFDQLTADVKKVVEIVKKVKGD